MSREAPSERKLRTFNRVSNLNLILPDSDRIRDKKHFYIDREFKSVSPTSRLFLLDPGVSTTKSFLISEYLIDSTSQSSSEVT